MYSKSLHKWIGVACSWSLIYIIICGCPCVCMCVCLLFSNPFHVPIWLPNIPMDLLWSQRYFKNTWKVIGAKNLLSWIIWITKFLSFRTDICPKTCHSESQRCLFLLHQTPDRAWGTVGTLKASTNNTWCSQVSKQKFWI